MSDITIKIHQGTGKLTGESLCKSCSHSLIFDEEHVGESAFCTYLHPQIRIRGRVRSCSDYYNKNLPSLGDMKETAWTLRTEKGGRMIGFKPPTTKNELEDD